jgi:hypothetical protein
MGEDAAGRAGPPHPEQPAMPNGLSLSFDSRTNSSSVSASYINTELKKQSEDVIVNKAVTIFLHGTERGCG